VVLNNKSKISEKTGKLFTEIVKGLMVTPTVKTKDLKIHIAAIV
jgi:hypothetical protein